MILDSESQALALLLRGSSRRTDATTQKLKRPTETAAGIAAARKSGLRSRNPTIATGM
jgi:hypothetical protein